jgi:hypothetical protein
MHGTIDEFADALSGLRWAVKRSQGPEELPSILAQRYAWLPGEVVAFLNGFEAAVSPDGKAWLTTCAELAGESDSAFSWDQWERDCLSAAAGDADWRESIRLFWDEHFPILMSVKSGYAYVAIRHDLAIVAGEDPEFEETVEVADDFASFLRLLAAGASGMDRWI